ncbi:putative F-box protein At1g47730 [Prunus dulcis]|uniref:putative F-box protein At1g47730 n=1 Tax=Prunus dulcis TaxID=3755 RepID=UPI0014823415|nr:putative F-box protein At1g47730 [Prunus dulcis]
MTRCRCVCKSWSSLIHSPFFVAAFSNFRKSTTNFIFKNGNRFFSSKIEEEQQGEGGGNKYKVPIPTPLAEISYRNGCIALDHYNTNVHKLQSVHGLVCSSFKCGPVFILNPTTRESIQLPHVNTRGFDTYHFGFTPLTNEYKVLQVISSWELGKWNHWLNVYTLGLGRDSSWRPLQVDPAMEIWTLHTGTSSTGSLCVNGAIHWFNNRRKTIVVFDVREESFSLVPLPEDFSQEYNDIFDTCSKAFASIVEVGGCVGVLVGRSWKHYKIVLWILKADQNLVWVKETITITEMLREATSVQALGTIHTGELGLCFNGTLEVDNPTLHLHLYNMKSKQYRRLDFVFSEVAVDPLYTRPIQLVTSYSDSIIPLK